MCLFLIPKLHGYVGIFQKTVYFVDMSGCSIHLLKKHYNTNHLNAFSLVCDCAGFVLQSAVFSCFFFLAHIPQIVKVLCLM